jgi:hypothetical protein
VKNKTYWLGVLDFLVGGTIGLVIASFFTSNHYVAAVWFIISGIILDTIMTYIKNK